MDETTKRIVRLELLTLTFAKALRAVNPTLAGLTMDEIHGLTGLLKEMEEGAKNVVDCVCGHSRKAHWDGRKNCKECSWCLQYAPKR